MKWRHLSSGMLPVDCSWLCHCRPIYWTNCWRLRICGNRKDFIISLSTVNISFLPAVRSNQNDFLINALVPWFNPPKASLFITNVQHSITMLSHWQCCPLSSAWWTDSCGFLHRLGSIYLNISVLQLEMSTENRLAIQQSNSCYILWAFLRIT